MSQSPLVRPSVQERAILSNLSYPSRPNSHISWSRSTIPLRFTQNLDARSHPTLAFSYASANATHNNTVATDDHVITNGHVTNNNDGTGKFCPVTHAFREIRNSIWHELVIFSGNLALLIQKLISTQAATSASDPSL